MRPFLLLLAAVAVYAQRPANYDDFVSVRDYASVKEAITSESYLYFPSEALAGRENYSTYTIENPVIIDRDTPLVMHGNWRQTTLVRQDKDQPFFIVRRCPYLNFDRLLLDCNAYPAGLDGTLIRFENSEPIQAEFQQTMFREGMVHIAGPGTYRFQHTGFKMHGILHAGLLIDHPGADVTVISSGGGNKPEPAILKSPDIYWLWCKRGHVETYGCFPAGFTRGLADIRIDCASQFGPHIIAYSRTESTKTNRGPTGDALSRLLYVPPTDEKVDIALKANRFAGQEPRRAMIDYNAAGTVWLIGNNATPGAYFLQSEPDVDARTTRLMTGKAPKATIVAIGNYLNALDLLGGIDAGTKIARANFVYQRWWYKDTPKAEGAAPHVQLPDLGDIAAMPPVPKSHPEIFDCLPVGDTVPKALDLVSVKTYGAVGDGKTDDTESIQAAFDSPAVTRLYFPPGLYLTSKPLDLRIQSRFGGGGWIVGAGSDKTRIKNTAGGTVVDANGLSWSVLQGIAFETVDRSDICFSLDKMVGHTTGTLFYDCAFIGGHVAMGIAMKVGPNCEHVSFYRCTFANADLGFCQGNPNALMNLAIHSTFRGNDTAMGFGGRAEDGSWTKTQSGNYGAMYCQFLGNTGMDFAFGAGKMRYFLGNRSDSPMITLHPNSGFQDTQVFEDCTWTLPAEVYYSSGGSSGPIFLNSRVPQGRLQISPSRGGFGFAVNLGSELPGDWPEPVKIFRGPEK